MELWVYVLAGLIIAGITLFASYHLLSSALELQQQQATLAEFQSLCSDVQTVCLQEVNNSILHSYAFPFELKLIFATQEARVPLKVYELLKEQQLSTGSKVCLQLKGEEELRCKELLCNVTMPYLGVLPEQETFWIAVSKLLGKAPSWQFELLIKKVSATNVTIELR